MAGAGQDGPLSDTWLLDLPSNRWMLYGTGNQQPTSWSAACVAATSNVRMPAL